MLANYERACVSRTGTNVEAGSQTYHETEPADNGVDIEDATVNIVLRNITLGALIVLLVDTFGRDMALSIGEPVAV